MLKFLLFPFMVLWSCIVSFRRCLYKKGILKRYLPKVKTLCIGNLRVGGTGKTPHTFYYAKQLAKEKSVAILSRGYGRKSKGLLQVDSIDAVKFGDEPAMLRNNLPTSILIYVCKSRKQGIKHIIKNHPEVEVIILDDAFQHLKIKCDKYILLTEYHKPYFKDYPFPMGKLREPRYFANEADEIIVTKTPKNLTAEDLSSFIQKLPKKPIQFSSIHYSDHVLKNTIQIPLKNLMERQHLVVTGIANPKPMLDFLNESGISFIHRRYPDHHKFSEKDIRKILSLKPNNGLVITTEKDIVKLVTYQAITPYIYALAIDICFPYESNT